MGRLPGAHCEYVLPHPQHLCLCPRFDGIVQRAVLPRSDSSRNRMAHADCHCVRHTHCVGDAHGHRDSDALTHTWGHGVPPLSAHHPQVSCG